MEQATQKIAREQKIPALPICFRLTVERGPDTGRSQDMPDGGTVGTSQATTFRLTDPTVSRIHLSLHATAEGVRIENRSLTNGTWLNGVRIREAFAESGAAISIGSTTLRLSIEADVGEEPEMPAGFSKVLGRSRAMRYALRDLARVASSDASLLLEGETGTGKGLVARAVHDASPRRNKPFIDVDCGSLGYGTDDNLMKSELFGHVRGAYSGATEDRAGVLELAHGGTIFLDEIGELPRDKQSMLLKALEERNAKRIGASRPHFFDVRVIAATNRDLAQEINAGAFREDLYYRLAVIVLRMPPLRDRPEDIPDLAAYFASAKGASLDDAVLADFRGRPWPGNARQLRNEVERQIVLQGGRALAPRLDADEPRPERLSWHMRWDEFKRAYLHAWLIETSWNVSEVHRRTGMDRGQLTRWLKELDLRRPRGPATHR